MQTERANFDELVARALIDLRIAESGVSSELADCVVVPTARDPMGGTFEVGLRTA